MTPAQRREQITLRDCERSPAASTRDVFVREFLKLEWLLSAGWRCTHGCGVRDRRSRELPLEVFDALYKKPRKPASSWAFSTLCTKMRASRRLPQICSNGQPVPSGVCGCICRRRNRVEWTACVLSDSRQSSIRACTRAIGSTSKNSSRAVRILDLWVPYQTIIERIELEKCKLLMLCN